MYANTYAPKFKGFKGDATYEYVYALVGNPNVEPTDQYYVLRIRKIEFGGDPNPHRALEQELANLYSWGFYNKETKEYGSMKVENGEITALHPWGNEEGVYKCDGSDSRREASAYEKEIRAIYSENKPAELPKEIPMKHRATVSFVWADGKHEQWEGPERDTGAEAFADSVKATFGATKPFIAATPEIKSYPVAQV